MSADQIQSFAKGQEAAYASAFIGSIVFHWMVRKWSRWIPVKVGQKGRVQLLKEHKNAIWTGKALTVTGIIVIMVGIKLGRLNNHDWRLIGLVLGMAGVIPVACMLATNVGRGAERIKEGMVALAISEKTPPGVLMWFIAFCFVAGLASTASLFFWP